MGERHREPEVPEEVPVVECLDGPARITSKELDTVAAALLPPLLALEVRGQPAAHSAQSEYGLV